MIIRRLAFSIDWNRLYVASPTDAVTLMEIVERSQQLERDGYSGPYRIKTTTDPFVERIELVEIEVPDDPQTQAPQPSLYTAAARGLP